MKRDTKSLKRTIIETTKAEFVKYRSLAKKEGYRSMGQWFGAVVRKARLSARKG